MDPGRPNVARIYDYFLGGTNYLPADQAAGEEIISAQPEVPRIVRENRAFLGRAVRHLAGEAGLRQFLDVGAGLPTMENVHQIAQRTAPDARVVYADNDPAVVAQSETLLADSAGVGVIEADIRDPAAIFGHPVTRELLDLTRPVGLFLVAILHFLTDEDRPHELVRRYLDRLAPGSYLVITHGRAPAQTAAENRDAERAYNASTRNALNLRSTAQITAFFDGLEILAPGVVNIASWPAAAATPSGGAEGFYGGIGRVRGPAHA